MGRHTTHAAEAIAASHVTYEFESTAACIGKAELAASEAASRAGFGGEDCLHVGAAVREAVTNAVIHGNKLDAAKHVSVELHSAPGSLTIAVRDEGTGWDPATAPDPLAPENLLKASGRGIFLIRAFMDEVRFAALAPGSEIIMTKFVRGCGRDVSPQRTKQRVAGDSAKEPNQ